MDDLDEMAAREVAAFVERFNYFRKPYNQGDSAGTAWKRNHGLAGDAVVHRAITGRGDIGLLMNKRPRFICFDVDLLGKGGDEPEPVEVEDEEQDGGSQELVEPAGPVGREAWDEAGPFPEDPREWDGWERIGAVAEEA